MNNKLFKWALLNASGVLAYVATFAWLISKAESFFGSKPDSWLSPVLFLMMFIVSASVTGSLVLLKPVLLYVEGQKADAVKLFVMTVGVMAFYAFIVAAVIIFM